MKTRGRLSADPAELIHHVGVGRRDRRRRRPPPRGSGCRTCNDTNTRSYRDGSAPSQSCRARQIAHVHSMFFNLSMQTVRAGPSSRLFRVRCRDPTFSCVSYKVRCRRIFLCPPRILTIPGVNPGSPGSLSREPLSSWILRREHLQEDKLR